MTIQVEKRDLINMLRGTQPNLILIDYLKPVATYNDNHGWSWDDQALSDIPEKELHTLYLLCKNSND